MVRGSDDASSPNEGEIRSSAFPYEWAAERDQRTIFVVAGTNYSQEGNLECATLDYYVKIEPYYYLDEFEGLVSLNTTNGQKVLALPYYQERTPSRDELPLQCPEGLTFDESVELRHSTWNNLHEMQVALNALRTGSELSNAAA